MTDLPVSPSKWIDVCKKCGRGGLKRRPVGNGRWALFENEKVEHNRLKRHDCQDAGDPLDDFEVLP